MLLSRSGRLRIGIAAGWLLASLVCLGTIGLAHAAADTFTLAHTIPGTDTVWRVRGPDCPAGSRVKVAATDGGKLTVEAA